MVYASQIASGTRWVRFANGLAVGRDPLVMPCRAKGIALLVLKIRLLVFDENRPVRLHVGGIAIGQDAEGFFCHVIGTNDGERVGV